MSRSSAPPVVAQLSHEGVAVIYVSHRLSEIRRVASTASGLLAAVVGIVTAGRLTGGNGVLFIAIIGNGLILLGVNPFFQNVVSGVIIVGAVLINLALSRRGSKEVV